MRERKIKEGRRMLVWREKEKEDKVSLLVIEERSCGRRA